MSLTGPVELERFGWISPEDVCSFVHFELEHVVDISGSLREGFQIVFVTIDGAQAKEWGTPGCVRQSLSERTGALILNRGQKRVAVSVRNYLPAFARQ